MKILTILLCILGGVILFLPKTPVPSAYQYPLLFLLLFVCSLIRAVQAYRQGAATGSTYTKVAAAEPCVSCMALPGFLFLIYRSSRK